MTLEERIDLKVSQLYMANIQDILTDYDLLEEKLEALQLMFPQLTMSDLQTELRSSKLLPFFICKNPNKQQAYKQVANEILKVERLPNIGQRSCRFNEMGAIVHEKTSTTSIAANYYFDNRYWVQKYTMGSGGHQNNVFVEVVDFLTKGSKKHKVGCFVDGQYWSLNKGKLRQQFIRNKNVEIRSLSDYV